MLKCVKINLVKIKFRYKKSSLLDWYPITNFKLLIQLQVDYIKSNVKFNNLESISLLNL